MYGFLQYCTLHLLIAKVTDLQQKKRCLTKLKDVKEIETLLQSESAEIQSLETLVRLSINWHWFKNEMSPSISKSWFTDCETGWFKAKNAFNEKDVLFNC